MRYTTDAVVARKAGEQHKRDPAGRECACSELRHAGAKLREKGRALVCLCSP
jgi:hypothetical protein